MTAACVVIEVGSVLHGYTDGRTRLDVSGGTIDAALRDLDVRHPGLRRRVVDEQEALRPHMALFLNGAPTRNLRRPLRDGDVLHLLQALSGG